MYLLDTDTLSDLMRREPNAALLSRLARTRPEEQFTSSINLGELVYGALRSSRVEELLERIEAVIPSELPVLPFDAPAARRYGRLRAELESEGRIIGEADLRIAAIALSRDFKVVTANLRHFERVPGLSTENWILPPTR